MKNFGIKEIKRKLQTVTFFIFLGFLTFSLAPRLFVKSAEKDLPLSADTKQTENRLPEIMDLHHKEIGLGQRWFFGIEVIDEEGDLVKTELVEKPKSAKFNQNTLTVDWTPQKSDGKNPKFVVRVTEIPRDKSRQTRTITKEFPVKVVKKPVQLLKMPDPPLEVDTLVTIIDPDRLKAVSEEMEYLKSFPAHCRDRSRKTGQTR